MLSDYEEESEFTMFGENVVIHNNQKRSKNAKGPVVDARESYGCWINSKNAKLCHGSLTDASAYVDFTETRPISNFIAYTG